MTAEETVKRRAQESAAVAKMLGIEYDVWNINDCNLVADLPTRKKMICYIRKYNPDVIITHRPNDYHADHRAAGQLVLDASYILTVPNECPEVPAMRFMPVIMYSEDSFRNPEFRGDVVIDVSDEIDTKLEIANLNVSQVYEWLPYTYGETVPENESERWTWLKGMDITEDTSDEEIMSAKRGYSVLFAKTAARFRKELIAQYGQERGSMIRYAECFEICDYGEPLKDEIRKIFFG